MATREKVVATKIGLLTRENLRVHQSLFNATDSSRHSRASELSFENMPLQESGYKMDDHYYTLDPRLVQPPVISLAPFPSPIKGKPELLGTYQEVIGRKLVITPSWKRPLLLLKDDIHRLKERYYEEKYFLPNGSLRGLYYITPQNMSTKRFVKLLIEENRRKELEYNVAGMITFVTKDILNSQYELRLDLEEYLRARKGQTIRLA